MPSLFSSRRGFLMLAGALTAASLVACAPARPATNTIAIPETTAADVYASSTSEAAPTATSEATEGELACRTKSTASGTTELILLWNGSRAKGSLHHIAPSGEVTDTRVHAERYRGMIVADDIWETDLIAHAAVVGEKNGKRYMRTGDAKEPWLACE